MCFSGGNHKVDEPIEALFFPIGRKGRWIDRGAAGQMVPEPASLRRPRHVLALRLGRARVHAALLQPVHELPCMHVPAILRCLVLQFLGNVQCIIRFFLSFFWQEKKIILLWYLPPARCFPIQRISRARCASSCFLSYMWVHAKCACAGCCHDLDSRGRAFLAENDN
jgi:hypothetical protein